MSNETPTLEGWHARAQPHPDPSSFTPDRAQLAFAVLRNAAANPEGFTLALFAPDIAIDASGQVLVAQSADFTGLVSLAKQTVDLPPTGSSMNAWRIAQPRTSQPIERLFVPGPDGQLVQTSVQGYEKGKTELSKPVGDTDQLPPLLEELFGLIGEARDGYVRGEEDAATIRKVKVVLEVQ
ncbi:hypothetical protein BDW22DRAFT_269156 [Trametopsis cervina]|nr:hypothetical protein BDW22DRAFT_269156 [Trametopsis cervina]